MRFCMVTTFYPPYHFGGDAIFVQSLAQALVARGHEVEVVHCEDAYRLGGGKTPAEPAAQEDGIRRHRLRSRFGGLACLVTQQSGYPGLQRRQLERVFDRGFDVVHFHNVSLIGGPGVLRLARAPVKLYTLHDHWLLCAAHIFWKNRQRACDSRQCIRCCIRSGIPPQAWRYTGLIRRSLEAVDLLLSPSAFTADRHREAGVKTPIEILPSFADITPPPAAQRRTPRQPRFLFVGRVTASKGIRPLLNSFARLPDYRLEIIGDGDLRAALQQQYAGCPNIVFKGSLGRGELAAQYAQATALILPSLAPEVLALCILEAMACATPVIARKAGGAREPIERTAAGILYESDEELTDAVHLLAGDAPRWAELSRRAQTGYRRHYSQRRHLDRYLGIIDRIRGQKGEPRR